MSAHDVGAVVGIVAMVVWGVAGIIRDIRDGVPW